MTATLAQALRAATEALLRAGVPDAAGDARRLVAHARGIGADRLTLVLGDRVPDGFDDALAPLLDRRIRRQPVSQITGRRLFWGRSFHVTPDVLDPRPETEVLVALALGEPFDRLLDLGTGSGAIALTLLTERPEATAVATDLSPTALAVARGNAEVLGVAGRVAVVQADWFAGITGRFDLIVSNPPYIAEAEIDALSPEVRLWEPRIALTPGGDGLDAYRAIAAGVGAHLAPGGRLLVEIGPAQAAAVQALFRAAGLEQVAVHPDFDGRDRVVAAVAARP